MRRILLAPVVAVALGVVSACTEDPVQQGRQESSADVDARGDLELTQENFVQEVKAALVEAGTVELTWTNSIGDQEIAVEGRMVIAEDAGDRAAALTMDLPGPGGPGASQLDLRLVDEVVYVNLGQATDDDFYRVEVNGDSAQDAEDFIAMLDQADPVHQLEILRDAVTGFSEDGDGGEIDGVSTTRYVLTVDSMAMREAQGLDPEGTIELPRNVDYVFSIGPDLLPRRMEVEIPSAGASTMEWRRWGQDAVIETPDGAL
ncbi:hypothetical protein BHE97_07250 [Aeromicrobium sp. PE09-221]|uniref:hypothetical protein n=1 Tax=Aeromicrobium sp. PE09-221 TaxID=1898043 RepID=UPI000B3E4C35|nr:hypothetical protein [Aeromicrobium sp. PE09-221]OUZ10545.1 hypothetical protein BHE97_07250 [Aeromicrobium sp. PE09-221]